MSMMIGFGTANVKRISLKRADGTTVGTITVRSSNKQKNKRKRSQYNFKELSAQLMQTRTSVNTRQIITRAYSKISDLKTKLRTGDYDEQEILHAITHAEKMVRIAKKRMKHLQEEEDAQKQTSKKENGLCEADLEEKKRETDFEKTMDEPKELARLEKEMRELMQELQEQMREMEKSITEELNLSPLSEEISSSGEASLDPEDLELLKKKHRSEELRDIMEADLKYLKAMFDKLSKEKQEGTGNVSSSDYDNTGGVALELCGMDIPVQPAQIPVPTEGGSVDVMT